MFTNKTDMRNGWDNRGDNFWLPHQDRSLGRTWGRLGCLETLTHKMGIETWTHDSSVLLTVILTMWPLRSHKVYQFHFHLWRGVLDTTSCDKVRQLQDFYSWRVVLDKTLCDNVRQLQDFYSWRVVLDKTSCDNVRQLQDFHPWRGVLDTTLYYKVRQLHVATSRSNKTNILLTVTLDTNSPVFALYLHATTPGS